MITWDDSSNKEYSNIKNIRKELIGWLVNKLDNTKDKLLISLNYNNKYDLSFQYCKDKLYFCNSQLERRVSGRNYYKKECPYWFISFFEKHMNMQLYKCNDKSFYKTGFHMLVEIGKNIKDRFVLSLYEIWNKITKNIGQVHIAEGNKAEDINNWLHYCTKQLWKQDSYENWLTSDMLKI